MLVLGTASVVLLTLLGWTVFNFNTGLLAGLLYGISPVVTIGSRMVQGENGLILFMLACLLFLSLFVKYKHNSFLVLSAIFAGVSCLFKLSGGVTIVIGLLLLLSEKKSSVTKFLLISGSIASLFFIYGLTLGFFDFWTIFMSNSGRYYGIGPEAIYNLVTQVKITNRKFLTDPLILAGWISFFLILSKKKFTLGQKVLVVSTVSYLATYLILGSYAHGWYAFPFFPFLILALATVISSGLGLILLLMVIGYQISKFIGIDQFQVYANYWRYLVGILLMWILTSKYIVVNSVTKVVDKILMIILLSVVIYINYHYLQSLTVDNWYKVF